MPEKQLAREEGEKGKNDKKTDEWRKEIQKTRRYEPEGRQPDGRQKRYANTAPYWNLFFRRNSRFLKPSRHFSSLTSPILWWYLM